jgi:hypothetical protein
VWLHPHNARFLARVLPSEHARLPIWPRLMVQEPASYGAAGLQQAALQAQAPESECDLSWPTACTVLDYCDVLSRYEARRRIKANPLLAHFQSLS